ncbi:MAG: TIGR03000 domain-containing protein [Planctomycetaceae bacterium]
MKRSQLVAAMAAGVLGLSWGVVEAGGGSWGSYGSSGASYGSSGSEGSSGGLLLRPREERIINRDLNRSASHGSHGSSGGSYGSYGSSGSSGSLGSLGSVGGSYGSHGSHGSSGGSSGLSPRSERILDRAVRRSASHGSSGGSSGSYGSHGSHGSSGGSSGIPAYVAPPASNGGSYGSQGGVDYYSAQAAPEETDEAFAYVVVQLPEDAQLVLGGHETQETGTVRRFKIPMGDTTGEVPYDVKVSLTRNGQQYVASSTEKLEAGRTVTVKVNDVPADSVKVAAR